MYIHRRITEKFKESLTHKEVTILLGARQVGKTSLVNHVISGSHHVLLNLDVLVDKNRLIELGNLDPSSAWQSLGSPTILAIDEAQNAPLTGKIVKGWYDKHLPLKVILLGSSSLELLDQTAESLTGRNEKFFLPPLLFSETLQVQSWYPSTIPSTHFYTSFSQTLQSYLLERMVWGSYPHTVVTSAPKDYLINVANDYLLKDTLQLGLVKNPEIIHKLLLLLAHQTGSEVSVNELANSLSIARQTVERYIDLLERTYIIFRLPPFGKNQRKEITKNHKVFFWDTGVRNAILKDFLISPTRGDIGQLWENFVVAEFAKWNLLTGQKRNLWFWRSRQGSEVDIIVSDNEVITAYEIKWSSTKHSYSKAFQDAYGIKPQIINPATLPTQLAELPLV